MNSFRITRSFSRFAAASLMLVAMIAGASQAFAARASNDDRRDATIISRLPFSENIDTTGATNAPHDPVSCVGALDGATVWYQFTPRRNMHITANTFGSTYDTVLSVWTGGALRQPLTPVACNDDSANDYGWSLQSFVEFNAAANVTYYIMVGSFYGGPGGSLTLNLQQFSPVR